MTGAYDYATGTYKYHDTTKTYDSEEPMQHDWDEGWQDAWSEYCTESEHAKVGP